jgi:hypothetical protein
MRNADCGMRSVEGRRQKAETHIRESMHLQVVEKYFYEAAQKCLDARRPKS